MATTVCVTGGTGYVASHLIDQLLAKGYTVHATVRSTKKIDPKLFPWLASGLPASSTASATTTTTITEDGVTPSPSSRGTLKLFEADLMKEGSFDDAVQGCSVVFHTASPFLLGVKDPVKEIIEPAINGVKHVLAAVIKAGIKTVVMTSSVAATSTYPEEKGAGYKFTENDCNTLSTAQNDPYPYSKTQAEKAAWKILEDLPEDKKFRLVTINPALVMGPILGRGTGMGESVKIMHDLTSGAYPALPALGWAIVDVRDVAKAHILAAENPNASGRYIVSNKSMFLKDISAVLTPKFPGYPIPTKSLFNWMVYCAAIFDSRLTWKYLGQSLDKVFYYDSSKIQSELGVSYTNSDDTLINMVDSMIDFGYLPDKRTVLRSNSKV